MNLIRNRTALPILGIYDHIISQQRSLYFSIAELNNQKFIFKNSSNYTGDVHFYFLDFLNVFIQKGNKNCTVLFNI